MRAAVRHVYGPADSIHIQEIATPVPAKDEVLVRVRAASVNLSDWELLTGDPFYYLPLLRIFGPRRRIRIPRPPRKPGEPSGRRGPFLPRYKILGSDFAGTVEAVGAAVTQFKPGDDLFGDTTAGGFGAFADFVCLPEKSVMTHKPEGMSYEDAASLPHAAFNALQAIRAARPLEAGQHILINGAGGAVGTLAIQLAKAAGVEVTAVDAKEKEDLVRSLGADHFIDYTREDFASGQNRYDGIVDVIATRSIFRARRALKPGGRYLMLGGSWRTFWQSVILGPCISLFTSRKVKMLMIEPSRDNLAEIGALVESGAVKPVIDRVYPLEQIVDAVRRVGDKRSLGKVVVTV